MTCLDLKSHDTTERYITGNLSEDERDAFEAHYFECDECFAGLEALRAAQADLRANAAKMRASVEVRAPSRFRLLVPLALAAAILMAAVLYRRQFSAGNKATVNSTAAATAMPDYAALAKVEPPAYRAPLLRDAGDAATKRFRAAMEAYLRRDYVSAIEGLHASLALDSHAAAPRFFLGASELLTGDWEQGNHELQSVADAGDTPFLDESRMMLARSALHRNDVAAARQDLGQVVAGNGDFSAQARDLLRQIDSLARAH